MPTSGCWSTADRRALLLADGFYEWLRPEDRKQPRVPFRFSLTDGSPFAFAGLWTPGKLDGEPIESATIVTTAAELSLVAAVHDRMPVILPGPDAELAYSSIRPRSSTWRRGEGAVRAARGRSSMILVAPANPARQQGRRRSPRRARSCSSRSRARRAQAPSRAFNRWSARRCAAPVTARRPRCTRSRVAPSRRPSSSQRVTAAQLAPSADRCGCRWRSGRAGDLEPVRRAAACCQLAPPPA